MAYQVKILAGLPTVDGLRWNAGAVADLRQYGIDTFEVASSLLANAFNSCWCAALNARSKGVTHFLLLHADVIPMTPAWPLVLHQEMEKVGAFVLSVALPIKSETGITSTAKESSNHWRPRRLTTTEILAGPVTWTAPDLLINTGLLLVDMREQWVEQITFTINDQNHLVDGQWVAEVEPEDWHFSRQCRALNVPVWVTTKISARHMGRKYWPNDRAWGEPTDHGS